MTLQSVMEPMNSFVIDYVTLDLGSQMCCVTIFILCVIPEWRTPQLGGGKCNNALMINYAESSKINFDPWLFLFCAIILNRSLSSEADSLSATVGDPGGTEQA